MGKRIIVNFYTEHRFKIVTKLQSNFKNRKFKVGIFDLESLKFVYLQLCNKVYYNITVKSNGNTFNIIN